MGDTGGTRIEHASSISTDVLLTSDSLVSLQAGNGQGHDQGFLSLPYFEELKVSVEMLFNFRAFNTGINIKTNRNPTNASAITGVENFAKLLANRYSSIVGCTRSWDSSAPDFLVIIDNMMNLEVLSLYFVIFKSNLWRSCCSKQPS